MEIIKLNKGKQAIIDNKHYKMIKKHKWHAVITDNTTYARTYDKTRKKLVYMHRMITKAKKGQIVDHINGCGLDNQEHNLRKLTNRGNQHNQQNRKNNKTSKYTGVHWDCKKEKWVAQIRINKKKKFLGAFDSGKRSCKVL